MRRIISIDLKSGVIDPAARQISPETRFWTGVRNAAFMGVAMFCLGGIIAYAFLA